MSKIRIVIADDHKIIREGLIAIFTEAQDIAIVGDVANGDELMLLLNEIAVDVVLLDMHMPVKNGIEVTREIKASHPRVKILINTMSELPEEIEGAVAAGVDGYVFKTTGAEELVKAIKMVAHGSSYYGSEVISSFVKAAQQKQATNAPTPYEMQIITLLHQEKSHEEIAAALGVPIGILTSRMKDLYRKYKVRTDVGLVKYAIKHRLIA